MITRIEALRYRCLKHVAVSLDRFHVLVGPNSSGKSTLLDVVRFLGELLSEGPAAINRRAVYFPELLFDGQGNRFELALELAIPDELRRKGNGSWTHCRYQMAIVDEGDPDGPKIMHEAFWLKPATAETTFPALGTFPSVQEVPETIMVGTKRTPIGWRRIVTKKGTGNDTFQSETSDWKGSFHLGAYKPALSNLPEDVQRFPVAIWAKRYMVEGVKALFLSSPAMRKPAPREGPLGYFPDGSDLPVLVRKLERRHSGRFADWMDHLRTALPDLRKVEVVEMPQNRSLYLILDYGHVRVPSWFLSDGTLRVLALTILAYLQGDGRTVLLEEPENGVHPQAIETIFQSLSSVYGGQVLMATHSPLILGLAQTKQILCFVKRDDGSTDVVRGDRHPRLIDWKGEVDLATLYASGVLG